MLQSSCKDKNDENVYLAPFNGINIIQWERYQIISKQLINACGIGMSMRKIHIRWTYPEKRMDTC